MLSDDRRRRSATAGPATAAASGHTSSRPTEEASDARVRRRRDRQRHGGPERRAALRAGGPAGGGRRPPPLRRHLRPARLRPQEGPARGGGGREPRAHAGRPGARGLAHDRLAGPDRAQAHLHRSPCPRGSRAGCATPARRRCTAPRACSALTRSRWTAAAFDAADVVIASGARPVGLGIPGEELVTTSDRFLELEALPPRIVFIGGGYISFEFAWLSRMAGAAVTILHRGEHVLKGFDERARRPAGGALSLAGHRRR